ncbi:MAG: hypothetical protein FD181_3638 [Prolixibacteraceae bacterium]|nr:MAG: hypothetical protein FD181_3638 [Prolixibacteraceae bacterium]
MYFQKFIMRISIFSIVMCFIALNPGLSQNLVKNPGFETGVFSPYWATWTDSINSSFKIDANNAYSGNFCAELTGERVYLYQPVNLEPNTTYKLSATIKTESGNLTFLGANNFDGTQGKSLEINNTEYKTDTLTFTTGDNPYNNPRVYIWKESGTGSVWIDNFSLVADTTGKIPDEPGGLGAYYVSLAGNDSNTGNSPGNAWQSIDKVNQIDFEPGDKILFEGGSTFNGTIFLHSNDSGTANNFLTFGSYGNGRALIDALTGTGLAATDCEYIVVKNLNFRGAGRKTGNTGNGLTFSNCSNIVVDSVEVSGFQHSGLTAKNVGTNYRFTNVYAHNNGYAGIFIFGTHKKSLTNIYIGHCVANNNPGDPTVLQNHSGNGIFGFNTTNLIIEYCRASNNGWDMPRIGNGPGGIWVAEADSAIIQYCISHDNKTSPGAKDGVGFDLDGGTTNSVVQYCLSYNNHGAGFGIYQYSDATHWRNNTIRYCISENDGNVSADGSIEIWNGTQVNADFEGLEFYNNVIYNETSKAVYFLNHNNSNFNFRNNIFISGSGKVYDQINGENFQGNNWYTLTNKTIQDSIDFVTWAQANNQEMLNGVIVGIYANPRFINPGNSTLTNPLLLSTVNDYEVEESSVVIDKGLDLELLFNINTGNRDYFGNPINQGMAFNLGIDQFPDKQVINLSAGWNIFSANLVPKNSNLMNILQPLINTGTLKKVIDEEGNTIEDRGIFGGWANDIGNKIPTEGYAINVTGSSPLEIYGSPVQLPIGVSLKKGWNIISWPAHTEQNGMDVFQTLISEGKLKKVMDQSGNTIEDWGTFGGWRNSIGNFKPDEGYKVNVTDDCTLTVNKNILKSQIMISEPKNTAHFIPIYVGNGFNHMNINVIGLHPDVLNVGDELAIFDKEICVGAVKIQPHHLRNFSISIVTSASDNLGLKGFTEGNPFSLKLWDSLQKKEFEINPIILKGSSTFLKNETVFVTLEKHTVTGLEETAGLTDNKIRCYPNPFSNDLTIEIGLENESQVQVEVLGLLGQPVKMLYPPNGLSRGSHQIRWNGENTSNQRVSAGTYWVRAIIGDKVLFEKVVCQ